jgi:ankyrin repeat protein
MLSEGEDSGVAAPVAYFYCARNAAEPLGANPDEVVRALLKQLVHSGGRKQIPQSLEDTFLTRQCEADEDGCDPALLSIDECAPLILSCLKENPATIIIDALDECSPDRRHELLTALDTIVSQAENVVKVLISSRDDIDIVLRLANSPNISISASDNAKDIITYTNTEVTRAIAERRLLLGNVSDELRDRIINVLVDGARGMFRWVALSIQHLCDNRRMILEDDLKEAIGQLPESLSGLYRIVYEEEILCSEARGRALAIRALQWLMCALQPLDTRQFIEAVSFDSTGQATHVSKNDIIALLRNFVVVDEESDVFRFTHLSVREYLETREEYSIAKCHATAAVRCASLSLDDTTKVETSEKPAADDFARYSLVFWPLHYRQGRADGDLQARMRDLFFQDEVASDAFRLWIKRLKSVLDENEPLLSVLLPYQNGKDLLDLLALTPTPLYHFCCIFGQLPILESLKTKGFSDWDRVGHAGMTGLDVAIFCKQQDTACLLLQFGTSAGFRPLGQRSPLLESVRLGQSEVVKLLLQDENVNVNAQSLFAERTPLGAAAEHGHWDIIQLLLARSDLNLNERDRYGSTALYHAARNGHTRIVRGLLHRADVDFESRDSQLPPSTALLEATKKNHFAVMQLLLEKSRNPNLQSGNGRTLLHWAVSNKNLQGVDLLLHHNGINLNTEDHTGFTPLISAIQLGSVEIAKLLLDHAAIDVNMGSFAGRSPLCQMIHESAHSGAGWFDVGSSLVGRRDLQVNKQDFSGRAPLHKAVVSDQAAFVELLLTRDDIDPNIRNDYGATPLWEAAFHGSLGASKSLIDDPRVDVNVEDTEGRTPLSIAAKYGYLEVVRLLLKHPDLKNDKVDAEKQTCLLAAACCDSPEVLQLFLDRGDDVNITNSRGQAPLHVATEKGRKGSVELLISRKDVDVNKRDALGRTPLWIASCLGKQDIVEALARRSEIDLNASDLEGNTPLHIAAFWGNVDVFEYLSQYDRIDLELVNCRGETSLWILASRNWFILLEKFLTQGGLEILNTPDHLCQTPLHVAVLRGEIETIKLLLGQPAIDLKRRNNLGLSPLGSAVRRLAQDTENESLATMVEVLLLNLAKQIDVGIHHAIYTMLDAGLHRQIATFVNLHGQEEASAASTRVREPDSQWSRIWLDLTGTDTQAANQCGQTSLQTATANGLTQVAILLLHCQDDDDGDNAASTAVIPPHPHAPLCLATRAGHEDMVRLLLGRRSLAGGMYRKGCACLDAAAAAGHVAVVREIEKHLLDHLRREATTESVDIEAELLLVGGEPLPDSGGGSRRRRRVDIGRRRSFYSGDLATMRGAIARSTKKVYPSIYRG